MKEVANYLPLCISALEETMEDTDIQSDRQASSNGHKRELRPSLIRLSEYAISISPPSGGRLLSSLRFPHSPRRSMTAGSSITWN
jgi:hypothetical protein